MQIFGKASYECKVRLPNSSWQILHGKRGSNTLDQEVGKSTYKSQSRSILILVWS